MRRLHKLQLSNISIEIESMLRILFGVLIDLHDIIISQDLRQCSNSSNTVTNGDKVLRKNGICFLTFFVPLLTSLEVQAFRAFSTQLFLFKNILIQFFMRNPFKKWGILVFFYTNNEFFLLKIVDFLNFF